MLGGWTSTTSAPLWSRDMLRSLHAIGIPCRGAAQSLHAASGIRRRGLGNQSPASRSDSRFPRRARSVCSPRKEKEDTMKRYNGGENVRGGYYWNGRTWELVNVPGENG